MKAAALLLLIVVAFASATSYDNLINRVNSLFNGGCGDGLIQRGEQCDDFNLINGDGCSSNCKIEEDSEIVNGAGTLRIKGYIQTTDKVVGVENALLDLTLALGSTDFEGTQPEFIIPSALGSLLGGGDFIPFAQTEQASIVSSEALAPFSSSLYQDFIGLLIPGSESRNRIEQAKKAKRSADSADEIEGYCGDGILQRGEGCDIDDADCVDCQVAEGAWCYNIQVQVALLTKGVNELLALFGEDDFELPNGLALRASVTAGCGSDSYEPEYQPLENGIDNAGFLIWLIDISGLEIEDFQVSTNEALATITAMDQRKGCTSSLGNECADGNRANGDGCDSDCKIEKGWTCVSQVVALELGAEYFIDYSSNLDLGLAAGIAADSCYRLSWLRDQEPIVAKRNAKQKSAGDRNSVAQGAGCGNRIVEDNEECDDGNTLNGDGCDSDCEVETGYVCNKINLSIGIEAFGDLAYEDVTPNSLISIDAAISTCSPAVPV